MKSVTSKVVDYLRKSKKAAHTSRSICKVINEGSGAVSGALCTLEQEGRVTKLYRDTNPDTGHLVWVYSTVRSEISKPRREIHRKNQTTGFTRQKRKKTITKRTHIYVAKKASMGELVEHMNQLQDLMNKRLKKDYK